MDLMIFVDVNHPSAEQNQAWSAAQKDAVCRGLNNYQRQGGRLGYPIKSYVNQYCVGPVFATLFEFHREDNGKRKKTVNSVYADSEKYQQCLESACREQGLTVSIHASV